MIFQKNILKIAENYDYFIFDIWGVIHDGSAAYPEVLERIKYLRKLGKKICFLSNAPRRAKKVAKLLTNFGIDETLYDFIITSGEATYLYLEKNYGKNLAEIHKENSTNNYQYYYIGPKKDADLLDGLGYHETADASAADFAVATGFDDGNYDIAEKLPQLKEALKNNLTMICVNPDLIVVKQSGEEFLCAGILALEYQKLGGKVVYFGKPHQMVYDQVLQLFSTTDKSKVLAIGDGIETDILGANNQGIDSVLVAGGILGSELKIKHGELPNEKLMQEVCDKYKAYPQFVVGMV
ncbi:MAG: hydrolase [Rickettsiaceae bacterium]|jgi:HAD superfamily hydrolase (TIGR01459 family)|nr:hydrolase [Rickettsiaceae bacterium]